MLRRVSPRYGKRGYKIAEMGFFSSLLAPVSPPVDMDEYRKRIKSAILDEATFARATFSGTREGQPVPWRKVVVRPVLIKDRRNLQFSYFDEKQDITKNYAGGEAEARLEELLSFPFRNIYLQATGGAMQVQISKEGQATVYRHPAPVEPPSLAHDRPKSTLLAADRPDPFLQAIGIMTREGRVRADMRRKFSQINEFLRLIVETGELSRIDRLPMRIVDCGCGSAHLTFAVYHYLNHILSRPAEMVGVDVNEGLLQKRAEQRDALGWPGLTFVASRIVDFTPSVPPDLVIALHACDTATDEALAQAIRWQSRMIFSAPCCHHHLQKQLDVQAIPPSVKPLLRHGILRDRLGDILTDTFRALALRIMGYRTDVVEFVSSEHTDKNLMIRAIKVGQADNEQARQEYRQLKTFWQVTPYLEQLLPELMREA